MDLASLRTKKKEELSAEELAFLTEHKAELTAEEQIAAGITEATPETPAPTPSETITNTEDAPAVSPELAALTADLKSGKKVVVDAEEYNGLKASVQSHGTQLEDYRKKEVAGRVDAHVKRGAIKADQAEKWTGLILADQGNEDLLKNLPDNPLLASELGKNGVEGSALEQLRVKASEIQETNKVDFSTAMIQARKENPQLATDADAEMKTK